MITGPEEEMFVKVRGNDGGSAPLTTASLPGRTILAHRVGIKGEWLWHGENIGRLLEIEGAIYRWRLPQIQDMIRKRLDES